MKSTDDDNLHPVGGAKQAEEAVADTVPCTKRESVLHVVLVHPVPMTFVVTLIIDDAVFFTGAAAAQSTVKVMSCDFMAIPQESLQLIVITVL